MTSDVRNIRSHYYKKVGFHGVEEKKTLEILFRETALDLEKLKHYCSRFPVTADRRLLVWKIVLDVLPRFTTSHEFATTQRRQQYEDLSRAVDIIGPGKVPLSHKFTLMWGLEMGKWNFDIDRWLNSSPCVPRMEKISRVLLGVFRDSEVDCYWLAKALMTSRVCKIEKQLQAFVDVFWSTLEKEDQELCRLLSSFRAAKAATASKEASTATCPAPAPAGGTRPQEDLLPLEQWFTTLLSGVLHPEALMRMWDRVIGCQERIVAFVAVAVVMRARMSLLPLSSASEIQETLAKYISETVVVSEEASGHCVCDGIDLCSDHGS